MSIEKSTSNDTTTANVQNTDNSSSSGWGSFSFANLKQTVTAFEKQIDDAVGETDSNVVDISFDTNDIIVDDADADIVLNSENKISSNGSSNITTTTPIETNENNIDNGNKNKNNGKFFKVYVIQE